jgi:hypothetical protein
VQGHQASVTVTVQGSEIPWIGGAAMNKTERTASFARGEKNRYACNGTKTMKEYR